jgi:hypothetical protein
MSLLPLLHAYRVLEQVVTKCNAVCPWSSSRFMYLDSAISAGVEFIMLLSSISLFSLFIYYLVLCLKRMSKMRIKVEGLNYVIG